MNWILWHIRTYIAVLWKWNSSTHVKYELKYLSLVMRFGIYGPITLNMLKITTSGKFLKLLRDDIDNFKLRLTDRWIPGHIRTFTVIQWNWNSSTHMNRKNILPSTMAWNLGLKNISFWKEPVRLAAKILYYDAMGLALVDWGSGCYFYLPLWWDLADLAQ